MNKKGEMLNGILLSFIGVIVALTIFAGAIVPQVGEITNTATIINQTLTTTNSQITLNGKSVDASTFVAYNATAATGAPGSAQCGASFNTTKCTFTQGNFTIVNNQLDATTGELVSILTWNPNGFNGTINASYVSQPDTFISDSGARSVTLLIVIFSALAIAVVVLARKDLFDLFG